MRRKRAVVRRAKYDPQQVIKIPSAWLRQLGHKTAVNSGEGEFELFVASLPPPRIHVIAGAKEPVKMLLGNHLFSAARLKQRSLRTFSRPPR